MFQAGLPVPLGFVVTAAVYRSFLEVDGLGQRLMQRLRDLPYGDLEAVTAASREITGWITMTPVPTSIREEIIRAYAQLAARMGADEVDLPVAVRSSATAEDLPSASFAGQQETYLNICSPDEVVKAVQKCWASLWTTQAISYRANKGFDQLSVSLAVVVQVMVPAEVAGVMFTANPVTGARDEILVSASYGLGEAVVSGAVTPDTFVLATDGTVREQNLGTKEIRISPDGCGTLREVVPDEERHRYSLGSQDLLALSDLARKVQAHFGSPQDTEWALSRGRLYLLQARPITTLDRGPIGEASGENPDESPLVARPPRGIENIIDHVPEPPMPLDMEFIGNDAFTLFFEKLGMRHPAETTHAVERADGRVGLRMTEPRLSPAMLWKFPTHLLHVLRTDPMQDWEPLASKISKWIDDLETERLAAPDSPSLADLLTRSLAEFDPLFARRYQAAFFPGLLYAALVSFWVRKAVGKEKAPELDARLYRATPYPTSLQNQAIARLASMIRDRGRETPEFSAAFQRFLADWGSRPVRGMIALPSSPTWSEQPQVVVEMIEALISRAGLRVGSLEGGRGTEKGDELGYLEARRQVEGELNPLFRGWFRRHLERARKALVVREEGLSLSEKYNAFLRRAILQLGEQLAAEGSLEQPEDIFYLLFSELGPAAEGALPAVHDLVERRKRGYRRLLVAHTHGQHWLFATGSIPPLKSDPQNGPFGERSFKGLAASQGQAFGPVRLIQGPEEFAKMRPGDILVAPFTSPAWTPLFQLAAAVVTDIGSLASHAAIVAREYGIPSVVAVSNATKILRDGQLVEVDGSRGIVTLLEATPGMSPVVASSPAALKESGK
jgi:pyruvate,water dikinase